MQTLQSKIFVFFIAYLFTLIKPASASDLQDSINQADSLFEAKKYTESFILYDSIFSKENSYSPQMLMKMAFVKEGIGDYHEALYFLNYLYFWHPEQHIADKMSDLANKHELEGFESNDLDLLFQVFTNYKANIIYGLMASALILIVTMLFFKLKHQRINYPSLTGLMIILGTLLLLNNYSPFSQKAIIMQDNTLVMTDASSASNLVSGQNKGNRITIVDEIDNWYLVELNDTTGYIKKQQAEIIKAY